MGLGQEAPLTPEYQAIFEASLRDQANGGQGNNYRTACILSGMPRIMNVYDPMEIIITGGTGLIGTALATELATLGHEIVVLSRQPGEKTKLPPGSTESRLTGAVRLVSVARSSGPARLAFDPPATTIAESKVAEPP